VSRFLGWTRTDGAPVSERQVRRLLAGPRAAAVETGAAKSAADPEEVWASGPAGLGGVQAGPGLRAPELRRHPSGTVGIGNVRLDEPGRLAHQLGREEAASDMDLVLSAFAEWGPSFADHLQGAFAVVLWEPASRWLVATRDPFGREPLFAYEGPNGVAVASDLNALRHLPSTTDQLDERRVADFLMFMHEDRKATFYEDIRRLPPGHRLVASPTRTTVKSYRVLSPAEDLGCSSDAEWEEAYRERLSRAVGRAMRGPERVGTWLSGGLDSSSVTCLARERLPESEPLPTFSLVFDEVPESDERRFIEAVHRQGGYEPHFVAGDKSGPLETATEAMDRLGEPFMTPNLFTTTALLKAAREEDIGVALDGFLGDSVTGHGTGRLRELALSGRWLTLAKELRAAAQQLGPSLTTYKGLLHQFVVGPLIIGPARRPLGALTGQPVGDDRARSLVQPDLLRRVGWDERARAYGADRDSPPIREQAAHRQEVTSGKLVRAVETAVRMGRHHGVSVRFPFADEDLISFCLALPARQKCRGGWTRVIARKALGDVLPGEIAGRYGKASLGPVFRRALLDLNRDRLQSVVREEAGKARAFLQPEAVEELFDRCIHGNPSQNEVAVLWNAVLLVRWVASRQDASAAPALSGIPSAAMHPA